jgi:integrase
MPTKNIKYKIDQRLIDKYLKEQRLLGERITLSDQVCSGLKLAINNKSCSWTYAYRKRGYIDGGKRYPQRTIKIGDPMSMSPAEARLAAEIIKSQIRAGEDPALALRVNDRMRRDEEARKKTCSQWLDQYTNAQMRLGPTKYKQDEVRNVLFVLQELVLLDAHPDTITPRHMRDLADMYQERPATGRQRLGAMSRFLDYLLDEEVITTNSVVAVSKRRKPKPPPPRENFFSPEQLAKLWDAESLRPIYQCYLRFMISTPLRAGEAAKLRWDQVDEDRSELCFTHHDTKNSEHFVMPLSQIAAKVIGTNPQDGPVAV